MNNSEDRANQDDADLVRRGRAGDRGALEALFGHYEGALFGFISRFVRGAAEPSDVYQEIVLRAIENIDRYNPKLSFRTWLFTLAANHCKNILRSREQRGKFRAASVQRLGEDGEVDVIETARDASAGPDEAAENTEFVQALERELQNLPPRQREVFILREFNDISFREIAAILKIPEATARSRMFFAIDYLRVRLREFSAGGVSSSRSARGH
ncbi:MAG: sigma-70 family RNA polymerase sigma factor [Candidatus Krumholzibacteriaceae bacterium]|jgi:RNA polymerase sigma-70 factor (ECF subfamily)